MKSELTTFCAAAALACLAAPAMAQTAPNFTGFSLGADLGAVNSKIDFSPSAGTDMASTDSALDLVGSYGFSMGSNWLGTVDLNYSLKNIKFGSVVSSSGVTSEASVKQHYAVSFAPGYRLGGDGLVYGKVALHSLVVNYTATSGIDFSRTHQGVGVGAGYATALNNRLTLRAELESVSYNSQQNNNSATATLAPQQLGLSATLLYKF
jgi:opacity protein-like surface antigen